MERSVALKKLSKMLGKKFRYQFDPKALTKDEQEAVRAQLKNACAERDAANKKMEERRRIILGADVEYQACLAGAKLARERVDRLNSKAHRDRVTVGIADSVGAFSVFRVRASGDSWEEVIKKLTKEKVG